MASNFQRASDFQLYVYHAIESGKVDYLKSIIAYFPDNKITDIIEEPLFYRLQMSRSLEILIELLKQGLKPRVDLIANALSYHIQQKIQNTDFIFGLLKLFFFLLTQEGSAIFLSSSKPNDLGKIQEFLKSPANRDLIIKALSEVYSNLSIIDADTKKIREYLVGVGIENVDELIATVVSNRLRPERSHAVALLNRRYSAYGYGGKRRLPHKCRSRKPNKRRSRKTRK